MDTNAPHSTLRQNLLLFGTVMFAAAGVLQFGLAFSNPRSWAAWLAPLVSWALAYLALKESRKHGGEQ
jgi:hypothetical protein